MKWIVTALVGAVVLLFGVAVWNVANAVPDAPSVGVEVRESAEQRAARELRIEQAHRATQQLGGVGSQVIDAEEARLAEEARKAEEEAARKAQEEAARKAAEEEAARKAAEQPRSQPKQVERKPVSPPATQWDDDDWDDDDDDWDDDDDDEWDD